VFVIASDDMRWMEKTFKDDDEMRRRRDRMMIAFVKSQLREVTFVHCLIVHGTIKQSQSSNTQLNQLEPITTSIVKT